MKLFKKIRLWHNTKKLKRLIKKIPVHPVVFNEQNDNESFSKPPFVPYERLDTLKLTSELLEQKRKDEYEKALEKVKSAPRSRGTSYSLRLDSPEGETLLSFLMKKHGDEHSFVEHLISYSIKKDVSYQRIYTFAHIDRRLFSKIISDRNYHPSKDTALALALALELNVAQAESFLASAGYTFSKSIIRDAAIKFFIENEIYDLDEVNHILYEIGEKPLGR